MSRYFPLHNSSSENIKVELDLSNYATKTDLKNVTHVDVSSYALKTNLAALKTEVDGIDTDNFVSRTKFEKDIKDLDDTSDQVRKRIPDVSGLAIKSSIIKIK